MYINDLQINIYNLVLHHSFMFIYLLTISQHIISNVLNSLTQAFQKVQEKVVFNCKTL